MRMLFRRIVVSAEVVSAEDLEAVKESLLRGGGLRLLWPKAYLDIYTGTCQLHNSLPLQHTHISARVFRLDVLGRLRGGRPATTGREYETLQCGHNHTATWNPDDSRNYASVGWYWRLLALASGLMLLGGLLILPSSFDNDPGRQVSQTGISVFGLCLLTAGLSFSALTTFSVRQHRFKADFLFQPCLIYSAVGLLNIFYDFIISSRYSWNTPALLLTVAAAIATIAYAVLLAIAHRKAARSAAATNARFLTHTSGSAPIERVSSAHTRMDSSAGEITEPWQDPGYYANYTLNAYPTAYSNKPASSHARHNSGSQPENLTEEEMQRQQMLMLLLHNPPSSASGPHGSTYHINLPEHDGEILSPGSRTGNSLVNPANRPLQPWDGVWRGSPRVTLPRIEP